MGREKMIEEMAVVGCKRNPQAHTTEECIICEFHGQCNAYRHAEDLIALGYRKIPDGAVVLTREELDNGITFNEVVKDIVRKETAREILKTLWDWKDRETTLQCDLYELAEKYGVEVDE